jgi:phosphoglycolate phosphatase
MRIVFLDLDGTLTDPKPGITRSIRHALHTLGREAPPEDALTWCIGPPLLQSFVTLLGDEATAKRALALYRERFAKTGLYENRVYAGVPEMLKRLRDAGFRLFLATSKPHVFASRITAHFGLDRWLDGAFGSELDGTRTDKTALLAHALEETGAEPGQAVMLGDREHDIIGARNNGVAGVGALWGYGTQAELQAAGATWLATNPKDAADLIAER